MKNEKTIRQGSVGIILATHNGECFLKEQIQSIIHQTYRDWNLYIHDDASCDSSRDIIRDFSQTDQRIHILIDDNSNLGAKDNFSFLMQHDDLHSYDYIFFSDQDDVWQPNKMINQLYAMIRMERKFPETALMVYSDMEVVDPLLQKISPSFMVYQGIHHENNGLSTLLVQNFVTGCTMLINRKLLNISIPIPTNAIMHDWWIALCAVTFGEIGYIANPLVKYRQHEKNTIGAKHIKNFLNPLSSQWYQHWLNGRTNLFQSMKQAVSLSFRIKNLDPNNPYLISIESYASLAHASPWKRIITLRRLGVHAQSKLRHTLLLSRLLLSPRY